MTKTITLWTTSDDGNLDDFEGAYFWDEMEDALDNCRAEPGRRLLRVTLEVKGVEDMGVQ